MRETYLLVPGANGTELLRTLSRFGIHEFGLRIISSTELAKEALLIENISLGKDFLPSREEAGIYDSFLRTIPYFSNASYADAEDVSFAIRSIRQMTTNETSCFNNLCLHGEFPEKNEALKDAYDKFRDYLSAKNRIDSISILQKALMTPNPMDADFLYLKEFPLSVLDKALLSHLSDGKMKEISLKDLFKKASRNLSVSSFTESYGIINECTDIINTILKEKIPLDECTIALCERNEYAQTFYDLSSVYGIPVTFGCGVPIVNANSAKLLKLLWDWNGKGFNGIDSLMNILSFEGFDREKLYDKVTDPSISKSRILSEVSKIAGSLRIGRNLAVNNKRIYDFENSLSSSDARIPFLDAVKFLSEEFSNGFSYIIKNYSVIRDGFPGRVDRSALNVITNALDSYALYSSSSNLDDIIEELLRKNVCVENSREGCIYITTVSGAMVSLRPNLFVAGLSADYFPGKPTENHLILDSDWDIFGLPSEVPSSKNIIARKKISLMDLLSLSSALSVKAKLSWAGFNLSSLKHQNPSSVLFEIYGLAKGAGFGMDDFEKEIRKTGYFDADFVPERFVGKAYIKEEDLTVSDPLPDETILSPNPAKVYSPTAIETYVLCPRRFYLEKILGIKEPEEDNPLTVIDPKDYGTLAHNLMKEKADNGLSKPNFMDRCKEEFDKFILSRPAVFQAALDLTRYDFLKVMELGFDKDPGNKVLATEVDIAATHSTGLTIGGRCDRIEEDSSGKEIIVDFKTGGKIIHQENDPVSCLQALLYAYIEDLCGKSVDHVEYHYLKFGKAVSCPYNDETKSIIDDILVSLNDSIKDNDYPCTEDKDHCKYCKFNALCGKKMKEDK